jgi:hypothetical protein
LNIIFYGYFKISGGAVHANNADEQQDSAQQHNKLIQRESTPTKQMSPINFCAVPIQKAGKIEAADWR